MRKRTIVIGYGLLVLWSVWPFLVALLGDTLADMFGAKVTCGGHYLGPCILHGVDICPLLNFLGGMIWFAFLTLPTGGIGILAFTIVVLVLKFQERRRRVRESRANPGS